MGSVVAETPSAGTSKLGPIGLLLAVALVTVVLDQLTKWWALEALTEPTRVIDLVWTLRLRVIYNTGTAFSLTSDSGPVVTVIGLAVVGYLLVSGRRLQNRWVLACYGLVVGGTVGNLLDRVLRDGDGLLGGPVIDFVDLQWFPVFNLADSALVVGILLLLVIGFGTDGSAFEAPAQPDQDAAAGTPAGETTDGETAEGRP